MPSLLDQLLARVRPYPASHPNPYPDQTDECDFQPEPDPPGQVFQNRFNEQHTSGSVAEAGDNIILPRQVQYGVEVLEVSGQASAAVTIQLKAEYQPASAIFVLTAGEKFSIPGRVISPAFDLVLNLSASVAVKFDVRWKPAYGKL